MKSTNKTQHATSNLIQASTGEREALASSPMGSGGFGRCLKVLCAIYFLWLQVIFAGLLCGLDGLVEWGIASFFMAVGIGLVVLGVVWSLQEQPREWPQEPLPAPPMLAHEVLQVQIYCPLCDESSSRSLASQALCPTCGLLPDAVSDPEIARGLQGYRQLKRWQETIEGWLNDSQDIAAQQVFLCSSALISLSAEFPCLQELSVEGSASSASLEEDAVYTGSCDRTWGDTEFVLDEVCASQEKTRVETRGSQRGLMQQALVYTQELAARLHRHICELSFCADDCLALESEWKTTTIPCVR